MGKAQPSGPAGFEQILPAVESAKGWHNLNRKHRRRSLAMAQAGRPRSVDSETGKVTPKRVRLKTQAAAVAFARASRGCLASGSCRHVLDGDACP